MLAGLETERVEAGPGPGARCPIARGAEGSRGFTVGLRAHLGELGVERVALARDLAQHLLLPIPLGFEIALLRLQVGNGRGQRRDVVFAAPVRLVSELGAASGIERVAREHGVQRHVVRLVEHDCPGGRDLGGGVHPRLRGRELALGVGDAGVDLRGFVLGREPAGGDAIDRGPGCGDAIGRWRRVRADRRQHDERGDTRERDRPRHVEPRQPGVEAVLRHTDAAPGTRLGARHPAHHPMNLTKVGAESDISGSRFVVVLVPPVRIRCSTALQVSHM